VSHEVELARAARLDCVHEAYDWDFDRFRGADIDAHWAACAGANPALYDGPVLLAHRVAHATETGDDGATFRASFFTSRFSRFLAWRDFGFPETEVRNCFSMAALRSADGAFLLGEMGPDHSAAGAIYFPAGTPDLTDIRDGRVDLEGNLLRELHEETGLSAEDVRLDPRWTIAFAGPRVACLRIVHSTEPAVAIEARVARYLADQRKPELSRILMVRRRADLDLPRLFPFVRRFLEEHLPD
jgi:8-oxo-dGTP pyrophosphatase MutT (NUDIX family)